MQEFGLEARGGDHLVEGHAADQADGQERECPGREGGESADHSCLSQFSDSANQSTSVLSFSPSLEDDGKYLTCRSENPFVADSGLEDKWQLVVHREY